MTVALLALPGCVLTRTEVKRAAVVPNYQGRIQRIMIVGAPDLGNLPKVVEGFRTAMTSGLARCGVGADIEPVQDVQLNAGEALRAAEAQDGDDATLFVVMTQKVSVGLDAENNEYAVTLHDVREHRDVWKAQVVADTNSMMFEDRGAIGARFASVVMRQMASSGILTACPR